MMMKTVLEIKINDKYWISFSSSNIFVFRIYVLKRNCFNHLGNTTAGGFDINFEEIGQIVEDVFTHLSECRNKKDFISIKVQIAAKYCFSNGK